MRSFIISLCTILLLFTSCINEKKENTTSIEDQNPETEIAKKKTSIKDVKWKLVTFMGKDVSNNNAFITFSSENNKVFGQGSCNNFSGMHKLDEEHSMISISKLSTTLKACPDMSIESSFLAFLEKADNFTIKETKMALSKSKKAPFAIFEIAK